MRNVSGSSSRVFACDQLTLGSRESIVQLIEALRVDQVDVAIECVRLPDPVKLSAGKGMGASKDVSRVPAVRCDQICIEQEHTLTA
jgi:hypothetical protein